MPRTIETRDGGPEQFVPVTPVDATLLQGFQFLRIGTAGNLVLKSANGNTDVVTIAVTAGEYVPFGAGYVMGATTAAGIVGMA